MKKTLLFLSLMMLLGGVAVAQPALGRGTEGKRFEASEFNVNRYVGSSDRLDCWITEGRKHQKQVALLNINFEPLAVIPLPKSNELEVLTASMEGRRVAVMLADQTERKQTIVYRCEVDLDAQTVSPYDTLVGFGYDRKDKCMTWGATSPDGRLNALVCIVQMNDSKQYRTYIALYDARMYRMWEKEFALGSMQDLWVTNEGRIVTLGYEPEGPETHFIFNVVESDRAATYDAVVKCDPVADMHLANVVGPYAVAIGTYHPASGRNADRFTAGVLGMSFHIDSAILAGITMRPLQNEDMNILLNKKTKKIQKEQQLDRLSIMGRVATDFGATIALSRTMTIEKTSQNGRVSRTGHAIGLHIAAVDTLGHICWVRNIRRNDVQKESDDKLGVAMAYANGELCVVRSEPAKSPEIYDIANEAKELTSGSKCNVVLYSISNTGDTRKLLLERKSKQTVFYGLTRRDGSMIFVSGRGDRTRQAELRFDY